MPKTFHVGSPSLFVNVTAWAALLLALFVSLVAALQWAQVASLMPSWPAPLPGLVGWLQQELPSVLGIAVALSLLLVASAVGLLLRLNWARRAFIALTALAIAANAGGLWLQHEIVQAVVQGALGTSRLSPAAAGLFDGLATAAQVLAMLLTVAACALLGWVIRELMSEPVRQEFA